MTSCKINKTSESGFLQGNNQGNLPETHRAMCIKHTGCPVRATCEAPER
jgi:hypothetical protein